MMSFEDFVNQPIPCRECCAPISADVADVDLDDLGQTVATCDECCAERAERAPVLAPADCDWHRDVAKVADLLEWLQARDEGPTGSDLIYLLRKPWKWAPDYARMLAAKAAK
jgi:hypothetical protein